MGVIREKMKKESNGVWYELDAAGQMHLSIATN